MQSQWKPWESRSQNACQTCPKVGQDRKLMCYWMWVTVGKARSCDLQTALQKLEKMSCTDGTSA